MKIPVTPPDFMSIVTQSPTDKMVGIHGRIGPTDSKGRYLHWDKMRHLKPPKNYTHEEWWAATKMSRALSNIKLNFKCKNKNKFVFNLTPEIQENLHWLDKNAAGTITASIPITNPNMRKAYIIKSLVREAISSSQLEGATTTRRVARDMIWEDRDPKDKSEQMIINNYHAMQFILGYKTEDLTSGIILELHKTLTEKTLENDCKAGAFRTKNDKDIHVVDRTSINILHTPPDSEGLEIRIDNLCDFANKAQTLFIHPVVKAIILHFILAYEHPFIDGNGRTARALFYWAMIKNGYWMAEFISISEIIKRAPVKYGKAFLETETDGNDLTYFILHQLDIIKKAIKDLQNYLEEKLEGIQTDSALLSGVKNDGKKLNFRQTQIISHALRHPNFSYSINTFRNSYGIAYDTARKDLVELSDKFKFLKKLKNGKAFLFVSPPDLEERIEKQKEK